ncbi:MULTISPECIES: type II toxin-antitoxin system CcdA family antitoxin [Ramlibacter]|uniref:Post-segregation antitoxin CcdA n=1 Tax=Ramlibacter pinisoli TaxID=2682844 RepID=A0A6N8INE4_9BURK|nr:MULTISPECIES: type II toxin-antitoxin system CcdA family antitoxin [Ramlibacter]MBA2960508.1 type II toxin-antitoxin system CcdA family antitoxin [Ramlibacter sp. CGMCC 1.13660]MVQ27840.1 post-segregation antitoxin CcdA [Ramlibacter pinisoli]
MPRPRRTIPSSEHPSPPTRRDGAALRRRSTNVTLTVALVEEAKELGVNLSQAAEVGVAGAVARKRAEVWLAENREALESSNAFVEAHGLPLARYRNF